jgi:leucyl aminopeptidase (aminopeptidase T)
MVENGARQGLENMLGLKPGEKVCVVTDHATAAETENAFPEVAKQITGEENVTVYVLEDYGERPLKEVPGVLEEGAKAADVTLFVAQSHGQELETVRKPFIKTAVTNGAAHGHCPGFTKKMMTEGMAADYNVVYALSATLNDMLTGVKKVSVLSDAGTDMAARLGDHPWVYSQPIARGDMANLPDGEIFRFPLTVDGAAYVDGCVGDFLGEKYGSLADTPVRVKLCGGIAVEIECPGNPELEQDLNTYVFNLDGKREFLTRKVGELALGTNLGVVDPIGNMLQDEKCGKALHFAFGNPLSDHGTNAGYECKGHIDLLIMSPTVRADDLVVMERGQYTGPVLEKTLEKLPAGYRIAEGESGLLLPIRDLDF